MASLTQSKSVLAWALAISGSVSHGAAMLGGMMGKLFFDAGIEFAQAVSIKAIAVIDIACGNDFLQDFILGFPLVNVRRLAGGVGLRGMIGDALRGLDLLDLLDLFCIECVGIALAIGGAMRQRFDHSDC